MKTPNQNGFMIIEPVLVVVIAGILGFTGWFVLHARQSANQSLSNAAASHPAVNTVSSKNTKQATTKDTIATTSSSTTQTSAGTKATTTKPSSNGGTTTPTTTPATTSTPLSVLTAIIADLLKNVGHAYVTANSVTVPGPIGDATARPLVFTVNGQQYFAYTQSTPPNFHLTAAETANSMAIVKATVSSPSLIEAYLDKSYGLTDANFHADGFSTGGN